MSYRIRLKRKDENIEIWDETPIHKFKIAKGTEKEEYPDYVVDKKTMLDIILFYKWYLSKIAGEKLKWEKPTIELFWLSAEGYFEKVNEDNMVIDCDNLFLQYFYLVDIYRNTDWENETLKITHW